MFEINHYDTLPLWLASFKRPEPSSDFFLKVPIAANWKGVCLQNTSKPHSYHLKIWDFFMTLWIGNGAVLKRPSP